MYVSVSRGKESAEIYTDDKERLIDAAERSAVQTTASDVHLSEEDDHIAMLDFEDGLDNSEALVDESGL